MKKKFLFRLEFLLKMRVAREGKARRDLEHLHYRVTCAQEKKQTLSKQIATLREEMCHKRSLGQLELQDTYAQILGHLHQSYSQSLLSCTALEEQGQELQGRLQQAIVERKVIEKIREKHYSYWCVRDLRLEESSLDEILLKKQADLT